MIIKRVIKIMILYAFACLGVGLFFAVLYSLLGAEESFGHLCLFSTSHSLGVDALELSNQNYTILSLMVANNFAGQVLFAVMTTYAISTLFSLSKRNLLLSDKLVVRNRGTDNKLTISVMSANKSRYNLYDIKCELTCLYYRTEDIDSTNKDTYACCTSIEIINYYRYSFDYTDIPYRFWEGFLGQSKTNQDEAVIEIRITGKSDMYDNEISVKRRYTVSDVVIASGTKDVFSSKKYPLSDKRIPTWSNINKTIAYPPKKEQEIINKIQKFVNEQKINDQINNKIIKRK